eukprot:gnl/TRDRNA2_/TRDRNA2_87579_c1_seq1.p1 gnl/TRDRNA2_/TRDRNA2_87579_c1~~gnl/TRDRNA2_/TRDRNA2_87579_c1_seq1.p1  ORF type:complete len:302 (+),score=44.65 gnl/TRDRNA2_/TRDRNA2_87579_c1_seq1:41-907(+)
MLDNVYNNLPLEKAPSYIYEMYLVRPSNPTALQHFYELLHGTAPLCCDSKVLEGAGMRPLQDYVAFGRLTGFHFWDKLTCDYCSIINGAGEYMADLLQAHFADEGFRPQQFDLPDMPRNRAFRWQIRLHHLLPHTASSLHNTDVPFQQSGSTVRVLSALRAGCLRGCADAAQAMREESRIVDIIRPVLEICWFSEAMEKRWCPFRHAEGLATALRQRPYYALDAQKKEQLEQALRLLREEGRITCRQCGPRLDSMTGVASTDDTRNNISPSIRDYYELLLKTHAMPTR